MMNSFITCTVLNIFIGSSQRQLKEEIGNLNKSLFEKSKGKNTLIDLSADGTVLIKQTLK
jgi:hypothetical protein